MGIEFSRPEVSHDPDAERNVEDEVVDDAERVSGDGGTELRQMQGQQKVIYSQLPAQRLQAEQQGNEQRVARLMSDVDDLLQRPPANDAVNQVSNVAQVLQGASQQTQTCVKSKCFVATLVMVGLPVAGGLATLIAYLAGAIRGADAADNRLPDPSCGPPDSDIDPNLKTLVEKWNALPEDQYWSMMEAWVTAHPCPSFVMQNQVLLFSYRISTGRCPGDADRMLVDALKQNWSSNHSLGFFYRTAGQLKAVNGAELTRADKLKVLVQAVSEIAVGTDSAIPPQLSGIEADALAYAQGASPGVVSSGISVAALDDVTKMTSAKVTVQGLQLGDTLSFTNPTSGSAIGGTFTAGTLALTGEGTVADYQAALRAVLFSTNSPIAGGRTIQFQLFAASSASNVVNRAINVTAVNPGPQLSGIESTPFSYSEGNSAPISAALVVVSGVRLTAATLQIDTGYVIGRDRLQYVAIAGINITGAFDQPSGKLTLAGDGSAADYQTAIRSVTFRNDNPVANSTRRITIQVVAGAAASNTVSRGVTLTEVNDPSVLALGGGSSTIAYGGVAPIIISPTIEVTDEDSDNLSGAVIQIASGFVSGKDILSFSNVGAPNVTGTFSPTSGRLTLTGTESLSNYRTVLRTVRFRNESSPRPASSRTVTFTVTSDSLNSQPLTLTINVSAI